MKPKRINNQQENLFEPRISSIIDPKNPLKLLADQIDWTVFEKEFDRIYSKAKGQPPKPIRLMVGLFMLQHTTGVSEEQAVAIWAENPYWQYFCGYDYFCWKAPLEASTMVRWRQRLKASGMEKILQATITQAVQIGVAKQRDFKKVIVDTTVMEKHIAYPTDSKLLNRARQKLVTLAKRYGLQLRQNYNRVASALVRKISLCSCQAIQTDEKRSWKAQDVCRPCRAGCCKKACSFAIQSCLLFAGRLSTNWYDKALQKIAGPRGKAGDNKREPPLKNGVKKFQA